MLDLTDVPIEVTLTDGSRWVMYYRMRAGSAHAYGMAVDLLRKDVREDRWVAAEDVDRVQRRHSMIRLSHVVSVREAADPAAEGSTDAPSA